MTINHPCYIMIICNKKKYINIITINQFNLLRNIYNESPNFNVTFSCNIRKYLKTKIRIIRDANIIHNFINNFGFIIGEQVIGDIINRYNDFKLDYDEISIDESDDSFL